MSLVSRWKKSGLSLWVVSLLCATAVCATANPASKTGTPPNVPSVSFGPFSTQTALAEAARVSGGQPNCVNASNVAIIKECRLVVVAETTLTTLVFTPSGNLLEVERLILLPIGMPFSEALAQAKAQYSGLGSPAELTTEETLSCRWSGIGPPCKDIKIIPPANDDVHGLRWSDADYHWALTISLDEEGLKARVPKDTNVPDLLSKSRRLRVHFSNNGLHKENRGRIEAAEKEAAKLKLDF